MKQKLRPPSLQDLMSVVYIRIPDPVCRAVDALARRQMRTRSDILRTLVVEALQHRGVFASHDEEAAA